MGALICSWLKWLFNNDPVTASLESFLYDIRSLTEKWHPMCFFFALQLLLASGTIVHCLERALTPLSAQQYANRALDSEEYTVSISLVISFPLFPVITKSFKGLGEIIQQIDTQLYIP